jgi:hypothetical protein
MRRKYRPKLDAAKEIVEKAREQNRPPVLSGHDRAF